MMCFCGWKVKRQGHRVNKCILHTNVYYAYIIIIINYPLHQAASGIIHQIEVWWVWWPHVWRYGLSFSNVCMRPQFMTSMSCDSIYCMCGVAWSSRWLMTQLTNGERACVCAIGGHFEHTLWLSIYFLCTLFHTILDAACNTQRVHY